MQDKDLLKYIKGESTPDEKRLVIEWIRNNDKNQKHFNILKAEYIASTLDSFSHPNTDLQYRYFLAKSYKKKKTYYTAVVASIIIIPFISWFVFNTFSNINKNIENTEFLGSNIENVITGFGDHKKITLPDGSIVVLNSGSSISFPKKFDHNIRKVTLTGEAFFDIKRNVNKPFIVNTDHIKIKVLGTSFNIKSYADDEKTETTLITGEVEVFQNKNKKSVLLQPSERATFNINNNNISVDNVNSKNILAWQDGTLIFDKTPLKQVISDLKRNYNIEFVILSDSLFKYKYTGKFDNLTLEEVLELLKLSSPMNYRYENNKIILDSE
ncbi:FecR family protein [Aquimarina muelleri]|uniref:Anti-sigma factor n=1 Tax=Aquimarina muelleri TaxID=279356 RepID=A0A918JQX8_9FLAO|nr:FecR domain-containing protein [Aquimarina muelleri]MCX2763020.1 FecR domain-containing protein [Aquimarina muelleri]GGX03406.1 anti-sigma factor [Aquimarina muelleri]